MPRAGSFRAWLTSCPPLCHVLHVVLKGSRWLATAFPRLPGSGNKAAKRRIVPEVIQQTFGIAASIAARVSKLLAYVRTRLAEPKELDRSELPRNSGARRRRSRIVR